MHAGWSPFSCTKVSLYSQVKIAFLYVHALGLPITLGLNLNFLPIALRNHPEHSMQLLTLKNHLKGRVLVPMMT